MNKKLFIFSVILILMFFGLPCVILAFGESPTKVIPDENTEIIKIDETTTLEFRYIKEYDELKVLIIAPRATAKTDVDFEEFYQKYINDWICDEKHRYYHYKTKYRKRFYSKIIDGKEVTTYEMLILLRK